MLHSVTDVRSMVGLIFRMTGYFSSVWLFLAVMKYRPESSHETSLSVVLHVSPDTRVN